MTDKNQGIVKQVFYVNFNRDLLVCNLPRVSIKGGKKKNASISASLYNIIMFQYVHTSDDRRRTLYPWKLRSIIRDIEIRWNERKCALAPEFLFAPLISVLVRQRDRPFSLLSRRQDTSARGVFDKYYMKRWVTNNQEGRFIREILEPHTCCRISDMEEVLVENTVSVRT